MCDPALAGNHAAALSLDASLVPLYRKMCRYADGTGGQAQAAPATHLSSSPLPSKELPIQRTAGSGSGNERDSDAPPNPFSSASNGGRSGRSGSVDGPRWNQR